MFIIVGLGNPGKKYELGRHNVGFWALDEFRKKNNFPEFKLSRKFNALLSESYLNDKRIILAKPQTFMNLSGKTVKALVKNHNFKTDNLIIIHDDIDLPLAKIRIVKGRGAAGHKGVESIVEELKTKNFTRLRMGIQPKSGKPEKAKKYVLQKFNKVEEKQIREPIKKICLAIEMILEEGPEKAMAKYN